MLQASVDLSFRHFVYKNCYKRNYDQQNFWCFSSRESFTTVGENKSFNGPDHWDEKVNQKNLILKSRSCTSQEFIWRTWENRA